MSEAPNMGMARETEPPLESKERIDLHWWDRANYKEAFTRSLVAFCEHDQDLIAKDREFSVIAGVSDRRLSEVAKKIQDQLGIEGIHARAEIIITLRNAQLSFLIDTVCLAFLQDRPMPLNEFESCLTHIVQSSKARELSDIYREILNQYENDRIERSHEEPVADFIIRTADVGRIVPDWEPRFPSDKERAGKKLKWMQAAIEKGELIREFGPKSNKSIERDVALIKLPFIDVLVCEENNSQFNRFVLTKEAQSRGITFPEDYGKAPGPGALYRGDACIDYLGDRRALITASFDSIGAGYTAEMLEEGVLQSFAHVRHEIKHFIDKKIRDKKGTNLPDVFYYPQGTYPKDGRGVRTVEESIPFEAQYLLDEMRALCIDGRLIYQLLPKNSAKNDSLEPISLSSYVRNSIQNLTHSTADGEECQQQIQTFQDSWQKVLDFLTEQSQVLGAITEEREYRFIHLVLYHCLGTSETIEDALLRLRHALAWIMTEIE